MSSVGWDLGVPTVAERACHLCLCYLGFQGCYARARPHFLRNRGLRPLPQCVPSLVGSGSGLVWNHQPSLMGKSPWGPTHHCPLQWLVLAAGHLELHAWVSAALRPCACMCAGRCECTTSVTFPCLPFQPGLPPRHADKHCLPAHSPTQRPLQTH